MPRFVCLPGDGIGPEVMIQATRVLMALGRPFEEQPVGGQAINDYNRPLPHHTLTACQDADAILLGAVGGPQWEGRSPGPEAGLIRLRKEFDVYANLRPTRADGIDLMIV